MMLINKIEGNWKIASEIISGVYMHTYGYGDVVKPSHNLLLVRNFHEGTIGHGKILRKSTSVISPIINKYNIKKQI